MVDLCALTAHDYVLGPPNSSSTCPSLYGQTPLCRVDLPDQSMVLADFAVFLDQ